MAISLKKRLCSAVVGLTVLLAAAAPSAAQTKDDAAGFVTEVGQQVSQVLDARGVEPDQRLRHFRDILVHAFDLDIVARRSLGRHWRAATDAERERYTALFRKYVVNMYAAQLGGYSGASFSVLRQQQLREDENLVIARFNRPDGSKLGLNVRVRRTDGRNRIVDITVGGISLIVTKRSEFDAVVRREGFEGLLQRLDERQASVLLEGRDVSSFIAESMSIMDSGTNVFLTYR